MALIKKATTSKPLDIEEFPEVPDGIPRDRWDRPLIKPPGGGRPISYTRASTLGKAIEDTYNLNMWTVRAVVLGMSRRDELVARAAAIPENEGEHRTPLDEIGKEAKTAGGGDRGANIGTALHKLSERRDAGEDLSYLPGELADAMDAYSEQMRSFKVLATETFVVCDPLETAGTFDRVVELIVPLEFHHAKRGKVVLPVGTILVLDLKTGKAESAKYWGPGYGVQQTVYACGQPYDFADGGQRLQWEDILGPIPFRPSTEWALILHVPSDSPRDAGLIIVDLEVGAAMADLCLEVRSARREKSLMSAAWLGEDVPVLDVSKTALEQAVQTLLVTIQTAPFRTPEWFDELYEESQDIWTDAHTEAVKVRLAEKADPAQVIKTKLIAALSTVQSEAELDELYETWAEVWDEDATRMAKARMRELRAVA